MIKRQITAMILVAPCVLLSSDSASTIILAALYVLILGTVLRSTIVGRRFLRAMMRDAERLDSMLGKRVR